MDFLLQVIFKKNFSNWTNKRNKLVQKKILASSKLLSDVAIEMLCDLHFCVWVLEQFQKSEFNWCAPTRTGHKLIHREPAEASPFPNSQTWTSSLSLVLYSCRRCVCSRLHSASARLRNIKYLTFVFKKICINTEQIRLCFCCLPLICCQLSAKWTVKSLWSRLVLVS